MKRKLFVFLGSFVLLTVLFSFSARGDYSFNDVQSGTEIAFTVGVTTPEGSPKTVTGVMSAGSFGKPPIGQPCKEEFTCLSAQTIL